MKIALVAPLLLSLVAAEFEGCGVARHANSPQARPQAVPRESQARPRSPQEIDQYKRVALELHQDAIQRGLVKLHSTITLSELMPTEQVLDLIQTFSLKPSLLYAFYEGPDGGIVTGAVSVEPETLLRRVSSIARPSPRGEEFLGIVSVVAAVPASELERLQNDRRVFLVDLRADESFARENLGNREHAHHLAWDLYQNGAFRFQRQK
jgi:hypothetical protein